jgi:hypothetical protein
MELHHPGWRYRVARFLKEIRSLVNVIIICQRGRLPELCYIHPVIGVAALPLRVGVRPMSALVSSYLLRLDDTVVSLNLLWPL